jgi:hypothetical protein
MASGRLSVDAHRRRAQRHAKVGDALADAGDEWAVVPYFYAAYHRIKCSLLEDPLFSDVSRMHAKHPDLIADDRFTSRHNGRKRTSNGREWGINELVLHLYPDVVAVYERLHQASNDVRYGAGFVGAVSDVRAWLDEVIAAHESGDLVARD